MGAQGQSAFQEILLGNTAFDVLRMSPVPVLVEKFEVVRELGKVECRRVCGEMFCRVLHPTDFSDCANAAFSVVKRLRGAGTEEVLLLHVQDERVMRRRPPEVQLNQALEQKRGRSLALSLVFAVGLSVTFILLGVIAASVGSLLGWMGKTWYYIVATVCIVIGLQLMGLLHLTLPSLLERQRERIKSRGLVGAFALGLVSGLVASQCTTPVLLAILTDVMAKGAVVYGATLLFAYALGRGVPIIAACTFAGLVRNLNALGRWTALLEKVSGAIVLAVGLCFLWIA